MTREGFGPESAASLAGVEIMPLPIVWLDIEGDPVRAWGGIGELAWRGVAWDGVGHLGEIGSIKTGIRDALPGLSLTIDGLPSNLLQDARTAAYRGRRGYVWIGLFDAQTLRLMDDDAALMFAGEISAMTLESGPGPSARIAVELESRMALLTRQMVRLRTDGDQQRRQPGDRFFDFVPDVINKTIYWGLRASKGNGAGGGGGGSGGGIGSDFRGGGNVSQR